MNAVKIISQKRDGKVLAREEVAAFISAYAQGDIPDYQMSALAMAIYLNGMNEDETASLTQAMLDSGTRLSWSTLTPKVDKHSTGGIGDKVSIILAPLLACFELHVPMISGRGLGPTGGTLDKLESIPGFRTDLSIDEIQQTTEQIGCVITGASSEIAPADKKLYALRDVTATVASIPLITASIMSKKLAENLDALVLDVKFGSGAFMKTMDEARMLARSLVDTGTRMGVKTRALLTDMNQPLGRMIGNAVEVDESIDVLEGKGPRDLRDLTLQLAREAVVLVGLASSGDEAATLVAEKLDSGSGLRKLREMVTAQGGNLDTERDVAPTSEVTAQEDGYVAKINTERLGQAIIELGGGRRVATDSIDHRVGVEMLVRLGDEVQVGRPLVRVFADRSPAEHVTTQIRSAISIQPDKPQTSSLVLEKL